MKNILKITYLFTIAFILGSCSDDDQKFSLSENSASVINTPTNGQEFILNPLEDQNNTAITFSWDHSNYGTPTSIDYSIEIANSGSDFNEATTLATVNETHFTMNIADFNNVVSSLGLPPFTEGSVDIRIKSTVGNPSQLPQYSNIVTILVTPFTTDLPKIAVPGNHQGWDPPSAPLLASSAFGETDYEGYVWLDGEFKFIAPNQTGIFEWGNTDWGDDGTFTGALLVDDETNCNASTAGYYFVVADTDALTYETTPVSWAIIGDATPSGWDNDTDLIYNSQNKTLELDLDLVPGPFKFRGNNEWGQFDLGTVDSDGFLQSGGDLTFDGEAGNYHIILDLSNPRKYTYSLTLN
ncbi:hypothetical protein GCM10022271_02730 [Corallibacter vietnamensis]|uniref:SusE outer membrane protein domain-containing protein n=1 Tax=Corallibacter vietnamensis TaxID=904130 RepID=A0ABP7GTX6_9FLAO